jgi:hypothetical protein
MDVFFWIFCGEETCYFYLPTLKMEGTHSSETLKESSDGLPYTL